MKTTIPDGARAPTLIEALVSLLSLVAGISVSIVAYGLDPQIPMLLGVFVASLVALRCGFSWQNIQNGMVRGINNALPALIILIVVGVLIGTWILAGVVPTLIYYGLQVLSPSIFLPATVVICAITSLATGTSWGTTGTIGVALMGIGGGLGIPLPLVAGAVLSGAYFGDKMSPLSDTTNMAAAMAGTDLFTHIKHMSYTTGRQHHAHADHRGGDRHVLWRRRGSGRAGADHAHHARCEFRDQPGAVAAAAAGAVRLLQEDTGDPRHHHGRSRGRALRRRAAGRGLRGAGQRRVRGYSADTGVADVDELLTRGGMNSMLYTISLVIVAMMFGGVMERTNQLKAIADRILAAAKSNGSLIVSTVLTSIGANLILCDQYMAIVMGARTYAQAYRERGLAPENLSRAVEDSATVTANLVPWNSGGAYQAATLGVATLAYLPFAFFCWLSPIVTIIFGLTGFTIKPLDETPEDTADAQPDTV